MLANRAHKGRWRWSLNFDSHVREMSWMTTGFTTAADNRFRVLERLAKH